MREEISFSICLPTYNRADFLPNCIESVIKQTYKNFEFVITDNCSTDNTDAIIKSYQDKRIKYYINKENVGLWGNHNQCIKRANNKWILFLHSDEVLNPSALELLEKAIAKNGDSNIGVVIPLKDRPAMSDLILQPFFNFSLQNESALLACITGIGNPSGMCFSKDCLLLINGFNISNKIYYMSDHNLLLDIINSGYKFLCIDETLIKAEVGAHQESSKLSKITIYDSLTFFIKKCYESKLFYNSIKLYNKSDNYWSDANLKKTFFALSVLYDKRPALAVFFKNFFRRGFVFSSFVLYGIGNIFFGKKFYLFIIKMFSKL